MINWKNDSKTAMWDLADIAYRKKNVITKDDIEFLKRNLDVLFRATKQKTAGQRTDGHDVDWSTLDITLMNIVIGTAWLYKAGVLDRLENIMGKKA